MTQKTWIALCSTFVLLGCCLALAEQVATLDHVKMKVEGSSVFVTESGKTHEVSIAGQFDAVRIDSAKLVSTKTAANAIYLLLDVTGPSKLPRDKGQCGSTTESNLIWLKLDSTWQLKEGVSFLYNSCLYPITMAGEQKTDGETLTVTTNSQVATYNGAHPEAGLKITPVVAAK